MTAAATLEPLRFASLSMLPGIMHGVTRREGPGLAGNMSFARGPDLPTVRAARQRWCDRIGVNGSALVAVRQVHGTTVFRAGTAARGQGALDPVGLPEADAIVTAVPDLPLMVLVADCVPILVADPQRRVVGVAHAGWRGTVAGIAGEVVQVLHDAFGCAPADLVAAIGPSIGPCCYEVGDDVAARAGTSLGAAVLRRPQASRRAHLDLWQANRQALTAAGVPSTQIEVAAVCTRCHVDQYFSHRGEGPQRGLFAAIICLA